MDIRTSERVKLAIRPFPGQFFVKGRKERNTEFHMFGAIALEKTIIRASIEHGNEKSREFLSSDVRICCINVHSLILSTRLWHYKM